MMTPITLNAFAKINLSLSITGRRDDGYHLMDSLVVFATLADVITLAPAAKDHFTITGDEAASLHQTDHRDNLITVAIRAYRKASGWDQPLAIHLEKNIPVAAGIGGGSSDAAAVIAGLNHHCPSPLAIQDLMALGLTLGADVPVCLAKQLQPDALSWRMQGIGEDISTLSLPPLGSAGLILINPKISLSTKDVFTRLNYSPSPQNKPHQSPRGFQTPDELSHWIKRGNDLLPPARELSPAIGSCLSGLSQLSSHQGYLAHGMSGSGATCFALFSSPDLAHDAAKALDQESGWRWVGALA